MKNIQNNNNQLITWFAFKTNMKAEILKAQGEMHDAVFSESYDPAYDYFIKSIPAIALIMAALAPPTNSFVSALDVIGCMALAGVSSLIICTFIGMESLTAAQEAISYTGEVTCIYNKHKALISYDYDTKYGEVYIKNIDYLDSASESAYYDSYNAHEISYNEVEISAA